MSRSSEVPDRVGYREPAGREEAAAVGVIDVEVPVLDELEEWFLEVRDVETRSLVTAIEILSPGQQGPPQGSEAVHAEATGFVAVGVQPRRD